MALGQHSACCALWMHSPTMTPNRGQGCGCDHMSCHNIRTCPTGTFPDSSHLLFDTDSCVELFCHLEYVDWLLWCLCFMDYNLNWVHIYIILWSCCGERDTLCLVLFSFIHYCEFGDLSLLRRLLVAVLGITTLVWHFVPTPSLSFSDLLHLSHFSVI